LNWRPIEAKTDYDTLYTYSGTRRQDLKSNFDLVPVYNTSKVEHEKKDYGGSDVYIIHDTDKDAALEMFVVSIVVNSPYFTSSVFRFQLNIALSKNVIDYDDVPIDIRVKTTEFVIPVGDVLRSVLVKPIGRYDNTLVILFEQVMKIIKPAPITVTLRTEFKNLKMTDTNGEGVTLDLVPVISWVNDLLRFVRLTDEGNAYEPFEHCGCCGVLKLGPY